MTTITRKRETRRGRTLLLALLAAAALALAAGAGSAAAAPASSSRATETCWRDVLNDWVQHQPNVKGTYNIACYTQAIQHLQKYPDISQYSNAPDDIHRAMLLALRNDHPGGPGQGSSLGPTGGGSGGGSDGGASGGGSIPSSDKSFITKIFNAVGPGDAQSVPLPLLVLAGLAVLLLLAAAGTWLAKRLQARRLTPQTAPVPGPRGNR